MAFNNLFTNLTSVHIEHFITILGILVNPMVVFSSPSWPHISPGVDKSPVWWIYLDNMLLRSVNLLLS